MNLKPGSRWRSAVCTTEIVVVRPPRAPVSLECGGHPMVPADAPPTAPLPAADQKGGTLVGKRYVDDESGLEALGTKAGAGSLAVGGRPMRLREAKPLPASD